MFMFHITACSPIIYNCLKNLLELFCHFQSVHVTDRFSVTIIIILLAASLFYSFKSEQL